jgi:hypothetical protein
MTDKSTKQRQTELRIWPFTWIKLHTPPPVQAVPERIKPSYHWSAWAIMILVTLVFILLSVLSIRDHDARNRKPRFIETVPVLAQ